ncbi:hypothetical protein BFJ72_g9394 [Fusarium proliferatum]|uniref:Uncharacterized protein n=1 Tax=Gibberella intermedia TaxID=948311 RepID=A0A420SY20_GIBIN|nr:hypothetical protein BFJ72_g9394 [Fusarium proliferatum]
MQFSHLLDIQAGRIPQDLDTEPSAQAVPVPVTSVATRVLSAPAGPGLAGLHIECLILSLACRDASVEHSAQTPLIVSVPTDTAIIFLKMPLKPNKNRYTKYELPVSATLRYSMQTKGSAAVQRRGPNITLSIGLVRRSWTESDIPQGPNLTSSRVSRPSTRDPIPWKPADSLKG